MSDPSDNEMPPHLRELMDSLRKAAAEGGPSAEMSDELKSLIGGAMAKMAGRMIRDQAMELGRDALAAAQQGFGSGFAGVLKDRSKPDDKAAALVIVFGGPFPVDDLERVARYAKAAMQDLLTGNPDAKVVHKESRDYDDKTHDDHA